jgi:hypothetical protein
MTTDSQEKPYRDGYAAGRRDGSVHLADEDESQMRTPTGDTWADDGYVVGFADGRRTLRLLVFSGLGRVLKDVVGLSQITGWLRRLAGST